MDLRRFRGLRGISGSSGELHQLCRRSQVVSEVPVPGSLKVVQVGHEGDSENLRASGESMGSQEHFR